MCFTVCMRYSASHGGFYFSRGKYSAATSCGTSHIYAKWAPSGGDSPNRLDWKQINAGGAHIGLRR